jgi:hypothetical protein
MEREKAANWHIRKEISVGHILTTLMLVITMVAGWYEIQNRLSRLEEHTADPAHAGTAQRLREIDAQMARVEAMDTALGVRLESLQAEILRRMDRQDTALARIEDRLNDHSKDEE